MFICHVRIIGFGACSFLEHDNKQNGQWYGVEPESGTDLNLGEVHSHVNDEMEFRGIQNSYDDGNIEMSDQNTKKARQDTDLNNSDIDSDFDI